MSSGVRIREGDVIPDALAQSLGLTRDQTEAPPPQHHQAPLGRPQAVGPVIAEAQASFGHAQPAPAPPQGFGIVAALAAGQRPMRPVRWFAFPPELWETMPDLKPEHRAFAICRLKVIEETRAQNNASGTNFFAAMTEQAKASVWKVGNDDALYPLMDSSATYANGWWEAIGPQGRQCVIRCYANRNSITDDLGEQILASGQDGIA